MEKTLVVFKPDAVKRGIIGEIITRFERTGLRIVGLKMVYPDKEHYHKHYEEIGTMITRHGKDIFNAQVDFMMTGPVVALVLEGVEAVDLVRKMAGQTEPKSSHPGTIRGDYAHISYGFANSKGATVPNVVHASGNKKEAQQEILHWFSDFELFNYEMVHDVFTKANYRPKKAIKKS
ncbi:MAG TPA: nucleoside-diphosphate kinase [Candidatus Saccharimonadales bacterium]